MSVREPQVIEGARGPRDARDEQYGNAPRPTGLDQVPAGKRVYQSLAASYVLQLTSPEDERLPDGRIKKGAKPIRAQFKGGFLIVDEKKDAVMIGMLDESDYNQANGGSDFWDFQKVLDGIVKARRDQAVSVLGNPADRAAIIEALKAEGIDFELPKARPAKQGATPTAEA